MRGVGWHDACGGHCCEEARENRHDDRVDGEPSGYPMDGGGDYPRMGIGGIRGGKGGDEIPHSPSPEPPESFAPT